MIDVHVLSWPLPHFCSCQVLGLGNCQVLGLGDHPVTRQANRHLVVKLKIFKECSHSVTVEVFFFADQWLTWLKSLALVADHLKYGTLTEASRNP